MMIVGCLIMTLTAGIFVKPFKWSRFFYTYIIPIVPVLYLFDGIMGVLRSYSTNEKRELIKKVKGSDRYEWELGKKWLWRTAGSFNYILGYPKEAVQKSIRKKSS